MAAACATSQGGLGATVNAEEMAVAVAEAEGMAAATSAAEEVAAATRVDLGTASGAGAWVASEAKLHGGDGSSSS